MFINPAKESTYCVIFWHNNQSVTPHSGEKMTHSFRIYQFVFISTFLLLISALLPIQAQVTSINASKIDDQETISVFFDSAQTFSKDALQSQFTVKVYDDTDLEYKPDNKGAW